MKEHRPASDKSGGSRRPSFRKRLLAGLAFVLIPVLIHAVISSLVIETGPPVRSNCLVKVLLASAGPGERASFSIDGPYSIFEGSGMRTYADPGSVAYGYRLSDVIARVDGNGWIWVGDKRLGKGSLCVAPERNGTIRLKNTPYPGALLIEKSGDGGILLINILDIEEYLACVLFMEMPSSFPEEALKSQIVAARSYALYMMGRGRGYLLADERSQVFGGANALSARSNRIAAATAGEILTFEKKLLPAYYSSTCGGMTVKADDVFPFASPEPLNRNNACRFCSSSPTYRWSAFFPYEEIVAKFGLAGRCNRPEVGVTSTDSTRRAREIALIDGRGKILRRLDAAEFRRTLNRGRPLKNKLLSTRIDRIEPSEKGIRIDGGGFGHGVGLCQYGARGLARRGDDYRKILGFYYQGCEIRRIAELDETGRVRP